MSDFLKKLKEDSVFYEQTVRGVAAAASAAQGIHIEPDDVRPFIHDKMMTKQDLFNGIDNPKSYLTQAVINGIRDTGRRNRRKTQPQYAYPSIDDLNLPYDGLIPGSDKHIEHILVEEHTHEVLDELPDQRRSMLQLSLQGYSAPEIAEILGVPDGTVKSGTHRATKTFVEIMKELIFNE